MVDAAEIHIWGMNAGAVRWDQERGLASFQFSPAFIDSGYDLSPIKMPLRNGSRIYSFPELKAPQNPDLDTFHGLPGLLADSLPDKYGNELMNVWLARQGRPPDSMNPVEKLCFIGSRGMGALEFKPAIPGAEEDAFAVEVNSLVNIARKMLEKRSGFRTRFGKKQEQTVRDILKIGTSAGGARPKALIAFHPGSGEIRSGQGNAPDGFEHWMIKLDGVSDVQVGDSKGWGRVEYAYYLMAKACGIKLQECRLFTEHGRAHFMTRRFDREGNNTRHHIQTFCGIRHFDYNDMFSYSYEQLFETMRLLRLSYPEAEEMFRRMVFNVFARNCDDHTKNFAFRLKKDEEWELAPAYDLCYSYAPESQWVSRQSLSVNGKRENISGKDLLAIAEANNIRNPERILNEVKSCIRKWEDFAKDAEVRPDLRRRIRQNLLVK